MRRRLLVRGVEVCAKGALLLLWPSVVLVLARVEVVDAWNGDVGHRGALLHLSAPK